MALVEFGRRRGSPKQTTTKPSIKDMDPKRAVAMVEELLASERPVPTEDLRGTTRISPEEILRMKETIAESEREAEERQKFFEDQRKIKIASKARSNAASLHRERLEKIKEKQRKAEEERVAIDLEEAKFQAERRKAMLDEARKLQFWQTDRVKGFHGALLLSEVLRERRAQIDFKNDKLEEAKKREEEEVIRMREADREEEIQEMMKAAEKKKQTMENKNFILAQTDVNHKEKVRAVQEELAYGEFVWSDVEDFLRRKKEEKEEKTRKKKELWRDNANHLAEKEELRRKKMAMDHEEMVNSTRFAKTKQNMQRMTKAKRRELFETKQAAIETNADRLDKKYKAKQRDEEERLTNAISEQEKKLAEEAAAKEAARRRHVAESQAHLQMTRAEKASTEASVREEETKLIELRQEADAIFMENEREKKRISDEENKIVNHYRKHQMEMMAEKSRRRKEESLAVDRMHEEKMKEDEEEFQEYAKRTIAEKGAAGCPTFPLERVARAGCGGGHGPIFEEKGRVRPSYMTADAQGNQLPCNGRQDTEEVKQTVLGPTGSKERLGFVW